MHSVAIKQELWEKHPWIARSLFKAFQRAKEDAYARFNDTSPYKVSLAWFRRPVEEQRAILGDDAWPYGLEKNRHVVTTLMNYLYEQGLAKEKIEVEKLFAPTHSIFSRLLKKTHMLRCAQSPRFNVLVSTPPLVDSSRALPLRSF